MHEAVRPAQSHQTQNGVGQIDNKVNGADQEVVFPAGCTEIGPVMKQLRETLTGIQDGNLEDKHGWVCKIDVD